MALAVAVGAGACHTNRVRTAPFRAHPSTTEAGDLRGPFSGQVIDASTEAPIAGALVYTVWTFSSGYGFDQPAEIRDKVVSTGADGRYEVPAVSDFPDAGDLHLVSVALVIYKRGYVAYRSDRRFADFGLRTDFTQRQNEVLLTAWRPGMSHARHLRYIGSGKVLTALTGWETKLAAAELSDTGGEGSERGDFLVAGAGARRVTAAVLLTTDDVVAVTGYRGELEAGTLGNQPNTQQYSSSLLRAVSQPEAYDVALRLWELSPQAATARYDELRHLLPGVVETNELSDRSLRANEPQFFGIAFVDTRRGVVGLLTCGRSLCTTHDMAAEVAGHVVDRLEHLWPLAGTAPAAAPTPAPTPSTKPAPTPPPPPATTPPPAPERAPGSRPAPVPAPKPVPAPSKTPPAGASPEGTAHP